MRKTLKSILKEALLKEGMSMNINGVLLRAILKFYYDNGFYEFTDTQESNLAGQNRNYLDHNKPFPLIRLRVPHSDPNNLIGDFYDSFTGEVKQRIDDIFVSKLNFSNWLKDFEIQIYKNALDGALGYATGRPRSVDAVRDSDLNTTGYQASSHRTGRQMWLQNDTQYMTVGEMWWHGETKSDLRQVLLECLKKNTIYHEFQHILQNEYKIHQRFKLEQPAKSKMNYKFVNLSNKQKRVLNIDAKDIVITPDGNEAYRRRKGKHPQEFVKLSYSYRFHHFLKKNNAGFSSPVPEIKFYSNSKKAYSHKKTGHPFTVFYYSSWVKARSYDDHSKKWGQRDHEDNADVAGKTQVKLYMLTSNFNIASTWLLSNDLEAAVQRWADDYLHNSRIRSRVSHPTGKAELAKLRKATVAYVVEKVSEVDWENFITLKALKERNFNEDFKQKWRSLWADGWSI